MGARLIMRFFEDDRHYYGRRANRPSRLALLIARAALFEAVSAEGIDRRNIGPTTATRNVPPTL
jgi:hypothetical protein